MDQLEILVFQVGSDCYGVRIDQVRSMTDKAPPDGTYELVHEVLGYSDMTGHGSSHATFLLDASGRRIQLAGMMGIIRVEIRDIQPMPELIRRHLQSQAIWGVVRPQTGPLRDRVVFLLDFQREENVL